ncbi:MAG: hypothetical protein M1822_009577 [Bathelium mastoideum]|nr:MAG: hypothetical protein M1822_009577 [Bathelium mastoideum]
MSQEMLTNLNHISITWWSRILQGSGVSAATIDDLTVESLELRVPGVSQQDLDYVRARFASKKIFSQVRDNEQRQLLIHNVESVPCLIPSLKTFFENLKYLEPCCQVLKRLLPMDRPRSIRRELWAYYYRPNDFSVEYTEQDMRPHAKSNIEEERWLAYQQLWLFCLRHFPELSSVLPRKETGKAKPAQQSTNDACWQQLGELAVRLGFRTPEAIRLQGEDPFVLLATRFLESVRAGHQDLSANDVQAVARTVRRVSVHRGSVTPVCFTAASETEILALDRRQGRPFEDSFLHDRASLFLPFLYHDLPTSRGSDITSFFVNRDFISHFVGYHDPVCLSSIPFPIYPTNFSQHISHPLQAEAPLSGTSHEVAEASSDCTNAVCPHANAVQVLNTDLAKAREETVAERTNAERQRIELEAFAGIRTRLRELEDYPAQVETAEAHAAGLQERLVAAESRVASSEAALETRMLELQAMTSERDAGRKDLATARLDIQEKIASFGGDQGRLMNENHILESELEKARAIQEKLEEEVKSLRVQYADLESKHSQLIYDSEDRCRRLEQELSSQQSFTTNIQFELNRYSELVGANEDLPEQFRGLKNQNLQLTVRLEDLNQQLSQYHEQIEAIKNDHKVELQKINKKEQLLQDEKARLITTQEQSNQDISRLQSEVSNLRQQLPEGASAVYRVENETLLYEDEDYPGMTDPQQDENPAVVRGDKINQILDFLQLSKSQLLGEAPSPNTQTPLPRKGFVQLNGVRAIDGRIWTRQVEIGTDFFAECLHGLQVPAVVDKMDLILFEPETARRVLLRSQKAQLALARKYEGKTINVCPQREYPEVTRLRSARLPRSTSGQRVDIGLKRRADTGPEHGLKRRTDVNSGVTTTLYTSYQSKRKIIPIDVQSQLLKLWSKGAPAKRLPPKRLPPLRSPIEEAPSSSEVVRRKPQTDVVRVPQSAFNFPYPTHVLGGSAREGDPAEEVVDNLYAPQAVRIYPPGEMIRGLDNEQKAIGHDTGSMEEDE